MCGILGFFSEHPIKEKHFRSALETFQYRGPDDSTVVDVGNGWLGHLRLAIIDLDPSSNQPFEFSDRYTLVFNGEIYNYQEVRCALKERGATFRTNSDTEVIVQAFATYGEECVSLFNGMFAFAIYDKLARKVFLARDRVGKKPLYFKLQKGRFVFASELKGILSLIDERPELNRQAVSEFVSIGYIIAPQTIYEHIHKLEAASLMEVDLANWTLVKRKYWDPIEDQRPLPTDQEIVDLIKDAVDLRFVSDVPVGLMLSGGLDSNIVLGLSASRGPQTFTIKNQQQEYDESNLAAASAAHFGSTNKTRVVTPDPALLSELSYYFDEPMADSSAISTYCLSQFIHQEGYRCVLNGDGADEIFGGYDRYKLLLIYKNFRFLRKLIPNISLGRFKYKGLSYNLMKLKQLLNQPTIEDAYLERTIINRGFEGPKLKGIDIRESLKRRLLDCKATGLNKYIEFDFKYYLPDDLLVKMDRATMANSLEGRSPFLDYRLAEIFLNVPFEKKVAVRRNKKILRALFADILPQRILKAKKRGFQVPIDHWFVDELSEELVALPDSRVVRDGYVSREYVERLMKAHLAKEENLKFEIYLILTFDKWYNQWVSQS